MRTAAKRDRMTRSAGVIVQNGDGRGHRWARLLEVSSLRDRLSDRILLPDLAEELDVRYHELYRTSRQLGLELKRHPTNRQFEVPLEAARLLRVEHARVRALHERSMKLTVAARQLNLAVSTVGIMAKWGELDVDPETDSSGARLVTRASLEKCRIARIGDSPARKLGQESVPLAEVTRFTGRSWVELLDLARAGPRRSSWPWEVRAHRGKSAYMDGKRLTSTPAHFRCIRVDDSSGSQEAIRGCVRAFTAPRLPGHQLGATPPGEWTNGRIRRFATPLGANRSARPVGTAVSRSARWSEET